MGSHIDSDHGSRKSILDELRIRSEVMTDLAKNSIATSRTLEKWTLNDIHVDRKEDDQHGVLRISIGEHPTIDGSGYCTFRGDQSRCISLLRRAIEALESR